ncbi:glycosyltransferase [Neobacillus sp. OS1-2]|uniref:glycosyltransferase n=1 Tax=Neobacillus sp. OS1-2 TaxID=3070680 RepID=UPI0027E10C2E|nr:glycosyltransferase [Neobacillus sp. OS1-2]WML41540.1 glycosyltransferase [Neobacillus sp. OS1-2]
MKILFFGTACNLETFNTINKKSNHKASAAPQYFQNLLLKGLSEANKDITIRTVLPIAHFPISRKKLISAKKEEVIDGVTTKYLPAVNFLVLKQLCYIVASILELALWSWENRKEKNRVVLIYGMYLPVSLPLVLFSKLCGSLIVTYVNDLPNLMFKYTKQQGLKSLLVPIYNMLSEFLYEKFDGYLMVSKQLGEIVNRKNKPSAVVEAFAEVSNSRSEDLLQKKENAIMYAGTLHKQFGIDKLLYAFREIDDPSLKLWIFGSGDMEDEIEKESKKDSRIIYFGMKPLSDVFKYEMRAKLLINPRYSKDEYTKYSFPSKTMEYMLSGTPVLMTHLKGIDDDYYEHVYTTPNESIAGWKDSIEKVMLKSEFELNEKGRSARQFIIKNKNLQAQTKKVIKLLYQVLENRAL